ncbi:MAG: hypothetical protein Q8O87_03965 [bacterium]|nr:hypothetical protein [bacterium]
MSVEAGALFYERIDRTLKYKYSKEVVHLFRNVNESKKIKDFIVVPI